MSGPSCAQEDGTNDFILPHRLLLLSRNPKCLAASAC